ncbi:MAG: ArsR family transcriptional regulator [Betaproteobacteria bacterium]|nr:ArsR family transcriptional regulator [Betaproteobacteria bacterium]
MPREIHHPATAQIGLSAIYDALSDPVRRQVIARLAERGELQCSEFLDFASKTALSYHFARLREAGLTETRADGKLRFMSLRGADVESRFPGLLPALIDSALAEAGVARKKAVKNAAVKSGPQAAVKKAPRRKAVAA